MPHEPPTPVPGPGFPGRRAASVVVPGLVALFLATWFRTAWVCDDAYITFRTLDNLWHGFGPVFNAGERVQGYTHPLWMLLVGTFYGFTGEPYFTSLALSAGCVLATLVVLARRVARDTAHAAVALLLLHLSRAFVDYSSSGLENPLTHLLLILFIASWLRWRNRSPQDRSSTRSSFSLWLTGSFLALTRPDAVLLVLPALVLVLRNSRGRHARSSLAAGLLPLMAWETFSLFYYGSLIPNTALAKLATGISTATLIPHGVHYLLDSLARDPITLTVVVAGIGFSVRQKHRTLLPLGAGVLLYLLFVVRIGGDFMSGRFLAAPLVVATGIVAATPLHALCHSYRRLVPVLTGILLLGLTGSRPTFLSGPDYGADAGSDDAIGITDERARYFPTTGLWRAHTPFRPPSHPWVADGRTLRATAETRGRQVVIRFAVGMVGFYAGPDVHIADVYALTDPLLARLRCNQREGGFRIGHFARWLPGGYLESLRENRNLVTNTDLARYYDKLSLVIRGRLWDLNRLEAVVGLNLGKYDQWLDAYRDPPRWQVPLARVDRPAPPDRTRWDARGTFVLSRKGMVVTLDSPSHAAGIELSLDRNDDYRITFLLGDLPLGSAVVEKLEETRRGLATREVVVPEPARTRGFDAVGIVPVDGDFAWALGHLHIRQPDPGSAARDRAEAVDRPDRGSDSGQ